MTTRISVIISFVFLLFPIYGNAQKYTLQQCLDFAVNNSYTVHRAKMDMQEAVYQRQETQAGVLPQVSASGSLDDNVVLGKVILSGEIIGQSGTNIAAEMGTKYVLDASARLEQVVFPHPCSRVSKSRRTALNFNGFAPQ